jgi:hypothetical protein
MLKLICTTFTLLFLHNLAECQLKSLPDACDLVSESDIQSIFGADPETLDIQSNNRLIRSNRKKCAISWDKPFSKAKIYIEIKLNDKKDEFPTRYDADMDEYELEGISIAGDLKVKMKFNPLDSLASRATYAGNLGNDKALIFHLENNYIISLHYQEHIDMDIGDYSERLIKLANKVIGNLDFIESKNR